MDVAQIIIAIFLLLLSGAGAFVMGRLTKISDEHSETQRALAVALNDIAHLKEKAVEHHGRIDDLAEMKAQMAAIVERVEQIANTLPEALKLMSQLAAIAIKRAA